jgi:hypothetical protein
MNDLYIDFVEKVQESDNGFVEIEYWRNGGTVFESYKELLLRHNMEELKKIVSLLASYAIPERRGNNLCIIWNKSKIYH